jgi:hypothetical protein
MVGHDCTPLSGGSTTELSVTGICRVRAVMESALNLRNSAAVPFCSHSRIINASLANYDTAGFKLGQLLETATAVAVATIRHGIISSGSNSPEQAHLFLGSLGRFAHKTLHGECVPETR